MRLIRRLKPDVLHGHGAKAGAYVDAVMKVLSWRHANEAFRRASAG